MTAPNFYAKPHARRQQERKIWEIEAGCECVGQFGPNPDCGGCGGDGSIRIYVTTPPQGYTINNAKRITTKVEPT